MAQITYLLDRTTFWYDRDGVVLVILELVTALLKWQISTWMLLLGVETRADKLFITSLGDTLPLPKRPQRTLVSRPRLRVKIPNPCCKP